MQWGRMEYFYTSDTYLCKQLQKQNLTQTEKFFCWNEIKKEEVAVFFSSQQSLIADKTLYKTH